ncbi:MAG: ATP-binding protein [Phototrophicaceae bacterium]
MMVNTENLILENRYLSEEVKRQTQEVKRRVNYMLAINTIATTVGLSLDLDKTLKTALEAVTSVLGAEAGGISLIDKKTNEVILRAQLGWTDNFINPPMRIPAGQGMSGRVIQEDRVIVVHDLQTEDLNEIAVPRFKNENFRSIAMAPMHARSEIVGIISIMSNEPSRFSDDVIDVLRAASDTVGVALENARLYRATVENESRLTAILQSTADGIIATDRNGTINLINQTAQRMLQLSAAATNQLSLDEISIPITLKDPLMRAIALDGKTVHQSFEAKISENRTLLVFVSPVYEETNTFAHHIDGWVIVLQDVSHLRQAEEMRAQFIQAAAHDMRNPLGVTMTSLGTLQSIIDDELAQEVIQVALSGVNRLQRLIDDLLHLERIEHGYHFQKEPFDIQDLLYEIVASIRPLIDERSQILKLDLPSKSFGMVVADPHWISRAITNYLGNAIKYSPSNSTITLKLYTKQDHWHVEVIDNGLGIPLDVQSRLFERFYRVKESSAERGSGLGLAIVKSVIEAHGGNVYMSSRVGKGSTFGFALPLQAPIP